MGEGLAPGRVDGIVLVDGGVGGGLDVVSDEEAAVLDGVAHSPERGVQLGRVDEVGAGKRRPPAWLL